MMKKMLVLVLTIIISLNVVFADDLVIVNRAQTLDRQTWRDIDPYNPIIISADLDTTFVWETEPVDHGYGFNDYTNSNNILVPGKAYETEYDASKNEIIVTGNVIEDSLYYSEMPDTLYYNIENITVDLIPKELADESFNSDYEFVARYVTVNTFETSNDDLLYVPYTIDAYDGDKRLFYSNKPYLYADGSPVKEPMVIITDKGNGINPKKDNYEVDVDTVDNWNKSWSDYFKNVNETQYKYMKK